MIKMEKHHHLPRPKWMDNRSLELLYLMKCLAISICCFKTSQVTSSPQIKGHNGLGVWFVPHLPKSTTCYHPSQNSCFLPRGHPHLHQIKCTCIQRLKKGTYIMTHPQNTSILIHFDLCTFTGLQEGYWENEGKLQQNKSETIKDPQV